MPSAAVLIRHPQRTLSTGAPPPHQYYAPCHVLAVHSRPSGTTLGGPPEHLHADLTE